MITVPIQTPNTGWLPGSNDSTIISRICVQASLADRWFSTNEMRTNGRTIFWRQYDLKGATTHSLVKERTSAEFSLMNNGCVSFSDLVVLSTKIDSTFPCREQHWSLAGSNVMADKGHDGKGEYELSMIYCREWCDLPGGCRFRRFYHAGGGGCYLGKKPWSCVFLRY